VSVCVGAADVDVVVDVVVVEWCAGVVAVVVVVVDVVVVDVGDVGGGVVVGDAVVVGYVGVWGFC